MVKTFARKHHVSCWVWALLVCQNSIHVMNWGLLRDSIKSLLAYFYFPFKTNIHLSKNLCSRFQTITHDFALLCTFFNNLHCVSSLVKAKILHILTKSTLTVHSPFSYALFGHLPRHVTAMWCNDTGTLCLTPRWVHCDSTVLRSWRLHDCVCQKLLLCLTFHLKISKARYFKVLQTNIATRVTVLLTKGTTPGSKLWLYFPPILPLWFLKNCTYLFKIATKSKIPGILLIFLIFLTKGKILWPWGKKELFQLTETLPAKCVNPCSRILLVSVRTFSISRIL